jgi:hypothetical protein
METVQLNLTLEQTLLLQNELQNSMLEILYCDEFQTDGSVKERFRQINKLRSSIERQVSEPAGGVRC